MLCSFAASGLVLEKSQVCHSCKKGEHSGRAPRFHLWLPEVEREEDWCSQVANFGGRWCFVKERCGLVNAISRRQWFAASFQQTTTSPHESLEDLLSVLEDHFMIFLPVAETVMHCAWFLIVLLLLLLFLLIWISLYYNLNSMNWWPLIQHTNKDPTEQTAAFPNIWLEPHFPSYGF